MEVTVALLSNAMQDTISKLSDTTGEGQSSEHKARFLIDGFPRKMDQALHFEKNVCESEFTLFYDCPEDVMQKRLLKRGETSGRSDDNAESITKRFRTFVETSKPVVDYFAKEGKVVKVMATGSPEEVYDATKAEFTKRGLHMRK